MQSCVDADICRLKRIALDRRQQRSAGARYTEVMAINAEVYVEVSSEVYFDLARTWLLAATPAILPEVWSWLGDAPPSRGSGRRDDPAGPPGSIRAYLSVAARPWDGVVSRSYSEENCRWFEQELRMRPLTASLGIDILDSEGRVDPEEWNWTVKAYTDEDVPSWMRLKLTCVPNSAGSDPHNPEIGQRWVDFVRGIVARVDPTFGYIGSRIAPLEVSYGEYSSVQIITRRDVLRGCSWVTICPSELFNQLGGIPVIEGTNLFSRIERTASGAAILQATEQLGDFGNRKANEIARCLSALHSRKNISEEVRRQRLSQAKKRPKLP
jgi:hypothetical protein